MSAKLDFSTTFRYKYEDMSSRSQHYSSILRHTANALSASRIAAAPVLFERIVRGKVPSWKIALGIGALALTDKIDGIAGRKADKLSGVAYNKQGSQLDQMADKALVHGVMGALTINEARKGNYWLAGAYGANQAIVLARDAVVTKVRKQASQDHKPTGSKRLGQIKTTVQDVTMAWATSPLSKLRIANKPIGEAISVAGFTISSALSVVSGVQLASSLEAAQPLPEPFVMGADATPSIELSIPQPRTPQE